VDVDVDVDVDGFRLQATGCASGTGWSSVSRPLGSAGIRPPCSMQS